MKRALVGLSILALAMATVACGGDDDGGSASGGTATGGRSDSGTAIQVTEKDFAIAVAPSSGASGDLTFDIHNDGPSTHEFVIFQTDLAPDALPTADDGTVDEAGDGVTHIDEVEDIAPGTDSSLAVSLDPGSYVFICNLPGHYAAGMHVGFTVE